MEACFVGNLRQSERIASTMMTLNSSEISLMKLVICFIKRSTDASLPVYEKNINSSQKTWVRRTYLQQRSNCVSGNATVWIRDEIFKIHITGGDTRGVD